MAITPEDWDNVARVLAAGIHTLWVYDAETSNRDLYRMVLEAMKDCATDIAIEKRDQLKQHEKRMYDEVWLDDQG